jgi:hypothetical protein
VSRTSEEFENFDRTMRNLMKVPHDEIKSELEAEKTAKAVKKATRGKQKKNSEDRADDK